MNDDRLSTIEHVTNSYSRSIRRSVYSLEQIKPLYNAVTAATFLRGETNCQIALIFDGFVKNERFYGGLSAGYAKIHIRLTSIILIHA